MPIINTKRYPSKEAGLRQTFLYSRRSLLQGRVRGLTLVEILISMLIFALIMGGLANLFVATKRHILHAHSRMVASELGRYFLDRLQLHVRQDTWNDLPTDPPPNNLLSLGDPPASPRRYKSTNNPFPSRFPDTEYTTIDVSEEPGFEEPELSNINYYPVYEVTSWNGLRKVKLIICWEESAP